VKEIEPHVASELCRLFPMDTKSDWGIILKRSKDAVKRVGHSKIVAPLGSSGAMVSGARGRGVGGGMKDRRDARARFPQMYRNTRPFEYGRYNSGLLLRMASECVLMNYSDLLLVYLFKKLSPKSIINYCWHVI